MHAAAVRYESGRIVGGRYRLRRLLGSGGHCDVYEAVQLVNERSVALKLLRADMRDDKEVRFRMAQEARALAEVRHGNLVAILDAELEGPEPFITLEMLPGRTLEGLLVARGKLPVAEAVEYAQQITAATRALHDAGWVHRDIKPANVFVVTDGPHKVLKLIDLGIALPAFVPKERRVTMRNTILGTVEYMAPEQALPAADGAETDARTDVWQLGATLFDMLAGRVPFEGNYPTVLVQMSTVGAPRLRSLRPDIPQALDDLVARALATKPEDRFPNAAAFGRALADLALGSSEPAFDATGKRRHRRAPFVGPVRATLANLVADMRSEDLSESGMLLLSGFAPPVGAELTVRVSLPISGRIATLPCTVRWVKSRGTGDGGGPFALGLEFRTIEPQSLAEIERYVAAVGG